MQVGDGGDARLASTWFHDGGIRCIHLLKSDIISTILNAEKLNH